MKMAILLKPGDIACSIPSESDRLVRAVQKGVSIRTWQLVLRFIDHGKQVFACKDVDPGAPIVFVDADVVAEGRGRLLGGCDDGRRGKEQREKQALQPSSHEAPA